MRPDSDVSARDTIATADQLVDAGLDPEGVRRRVGDAYHGLAGEMCWLADLLSDWGLVAPGGMGHGG